MIQREALLGDLQQQVKFLESSLRERLEETPGHREKQVAEYTEAKTHGRTAESLTAWLDARLNQIAASWVLATVFSRFLEDNGLVAPPRLSGPGKALGRSLDEETLFFRKHPELSHREYLESVFRSHATLPSLDGVLGEAQNPLWILGPTADGAKALLEFWRRRDHETGELIHDFTDPDWDTRFLGDLYQDLSELARKRFALLQTPRFVEQLILDRTLDRAIDEFGLEEVRLIDPACGSGHFLLGAFERLLKRWQACEPGTNPRALAQRALQAISGVDVNPFAIAIAKFRLLLAAVRSCGIRMLSVAPGFSLHLAAGDSLLHGPRPNEFLGRQTYLNGTDELAHVYEVEDASELRQILGNTYHVVVANPPYDRPKDSALVSAYRDRFSSCYGKFHLTEPFLERCLDLCTRDSEDNQVAGYVGLILDSSFASQKYGKKVIEELLPQWDLTTVIDTSRVHFPPPGFGTPTMILLIRGRPPIAGEIKHVRGTREQQPPPSDPAEGLVWRALLESLGGSSTSSYADCRMVKRSKLSKHPWAQLAGSGPGQATPLILHVLEEAGARKTAEVADVGFMVITGEDNFFSVPHHYSRYFPERTRPLVVGGGVRHWGADADQSIVFCYAKTPAGGLKPSIPTPDSRAGKLAWRCRTSLQLRRMFKKTPSEHGKHWLECLQFIDERVQATFAIAFAERNSHNHFCRVPDRYIFNQTAPVLTLKDGRTEDEGFGLLAVLNSSLTMWSLRRVLRPKTAWRATSEPWDECLGISCGAVESLPIPPTFGRLSELGKRCTAVALEIKELLLQVPSCVERGDDTEAIRAEIDGLRGQLVALQEEVDWLTYQQGGLFDSSAGLTLTTVDAIPCVEPGQRAFEIALARAVEHGGQETTWFEKHGAHPTQAVPNSWPDSYRAVVERRLSAISSDERFQLLERPRFKRRWHFESWECTLRRLLRDWLVNRLDTPRYWPEPGLRSCAELADLTLGDAEFKRAAALYVGSEQTDMGALVAELICAEGVPAIASLIYKPSGMRKHKEWEETWAAQREEDQGNQAPEPRTAPQKFKSEDFREHYWRHRKKLDLPKERFTLFPGAERDQDPSPVAGLASWSELDKAKAIAAYYLDRKDHDGWSHDRLVPLLVALHELTPWLKQWHNDFNPEFGVGLGDYFEGFLEEETRALEVTTDDISSWEPSAEILKGIRATRPKKAKKKTQKKKTAARKKTTQKKRPVRKKLPSKRGS